MAEVEILKRHPFCTQEVQVRVQERMQIYLALHFSGKKDSELMEKEFLLGRIRRPLLLIAVLRGLEQKGSERLHCPFLLVCSNSPFSFPWIAQ